MRVHEVEEGKRRVAGLNGVVNAHGMRRERID